MKRWFSSLEHAMRGVIVFFRTERNARIELLFALVAIFLGCIFHISVTEFCMVLLCIAAVMGAEAINSAIEHLSNFQTQEIHPAIRDIKDISAGAVLITSVIALVVGILIFGPRVILLIAGT